MIDFEKELALILANDPLGLLKSKPKVSSTISADERLISSFEEINSFIIEHGREPAESRDISERRLFSRLKGLRDSPEKAAALEQYDSHGLLADVKFPEPIEINSVDDILNDDALGLLDGTTDEENPDDIFSLKNVPKRDRKPDYIAKRQVCNEFDRFEPLFKNCHAGLSAGKLETRPFKSEQEILKDRFFILQGLLVFVANVGKEEKKKFGNKDARLYCVFENGTESHMLLRSLAAAFWKDENSCRIVKRGDKEIRNITPDDASSGFIYILKSLSTNPEIREMDNLYKIGYASDSVKNRIKNANLEPTYLMADVKVVSEFQAFNLNPQKFELLIHKFFAKACLNVDIFDGNGKRHSPREWFVAPLKAIETAIQLLINGEILNYQYDDHLQEIVEK